MSYSINFTCGNEVIEKIANTESETGDTKEFDLIYKMIHSTFLGQRKAKKLFFMKFVNRSPAFPALPTASIKIMYTAALSIPVPWRWDRGR